MRLGSFNDRFRDALMGGSPFASPRYQGFATGLATAPNAFTQARWPRRAPPSPACPRMFGRQRAQVAGHMGAVHKPSCRSCRCACRLAGRPGGGAACRLGAGSAALAGNPAARAGAESAIRTVARRPAVSSRLVTLVQRPPDPCHRAVPYPYPIPQADMAPGEQRTLLAEYTDLLRLSLAGNLRDYELVNAAGARLAGRRVLYNGVPAAYAASPDESVQYAACHDNETLFDQARARPVSQACAAV